MYGHQLFALLISRGRFTFLTNDISIGPRNNNVNDIMTITLNMIVDTCIGA